MAFPTDWSLLQTTTVDISSLALGGTLANYTVILRGEQFVASTYSSTDNGGGDLRFSSDEAGSTQIPCHIVKYDTSGSAADVRVRVPGLATATTDIYVWGDNSGTTQPTRTDTYGQNNAYHANYELVLPLEGTSLDATNEENNGTDTAITYGTANGKIEQGALFTPGSSSKIQLANDASLQPSTNDWSVTFWANRTGAGSADTPPVVASRNWLAGAEPGYSVAIRGSNGALSSHYSDGTTGFDSLDGTVVANGTGVWEFFTAIFDNTNNQLKYYKNEGTTTETIGTTFPTTVAQTNAVTIGRDQVNTRQYDGKFDEIRVYRGALTTDWIKTEYFLQNDPATYITSAATAINRSLADSMGLTDSQNYVTTYNRSLADSEGLTDVLNVGLLLERALADSMGISDIFSLELTLGISLSDNIGLSDALDTTTAYSRSLIDSEGLTDVLNLALEINLALADSLGVSDVVNAGILINRALADSMGITDAVGIAERILKQSIVKLEEIMDIKIKFEDILDIKIELEDIDDK